MSCVASTRGALGLLVCFVTGRCCVWVVPRLAVRRTQGAAGRCPGQSPGHLAGLGGNLLPGQPSCHRQHWGVCAPAQWMGLRVTSVCRWSVRSNGLKTPGRRSVFHAEVATRGRCAGNAACRFTQSPSDFALGGLRGALSGVALRLPWGRRPARRCFGLRVAA